MIATQTPTVEEWIRQHGDRCECVRGEPLEKPMPVGSHSDPRMNLGAELRDYFRRTGSGRVRPEWHHQFGPPDDIRIYIPDLAVVLAPRHKDLPECAESASDIMIEVASPNHGAELADEVEFYLHNGARRVWVVDPPRKCVNLYSPDSPPRSVGNGGILTDELLPGFALPLAVLFE